MPISSAITKAINLFDAHKIIGESDFSEVAELDFSLSAILSSSGGVLTFKILDDATESLYPSGVVIHAVYSIDCHNEHVVHYQERLDLNMPVNIGLVSLSFDGLEKAYTQLAIGSEVLALLFNKFRNLNK